MRNNPASGCTTPEGLFTPSQIPCTAQETTELTRESNRLDSAAMNARDQLRNEGVRGQAAIAAVGPRRPRPSPLLHNGTRPSNVRQPGSVDINVSNNFWTRPSTTQKVGFVQVITETGFQPNKVDICATMVSVKGFPAIISLDVDLRLSVQAARERELRLLRVVVLEGR